MLIEDLSCFHLMQSQGCSDIKIANLTRLNDVLIIPRSPIAAPKIDLSPQ